MAAGPDRRRRRSLAARSAMLDAPAEITAKLPNISLFARITPRAKSCVDGGLSLSIDPLPADELDAAKAAWVRDSYSYDGKSCNSAFPRKTFVSEFVASDTGELFLFVNDAAHVSLDGRKQIFYDNNTGTAKVTIERLPRDATRATTASAP